MRDHPTSQAVILNAASIIERTDPVRGLALLRQARALSPEHRSNIDGEIASIYTAAEMKGAGSKFMVNNIQMSAETAATLHADLATSQDPALLTLVSQFLPSAIPAEDVDLQAIAVALLEKANRLDPTHRTQRQEHQLMYAQVAEAMKSEHPTLQSAFSGIRISPKDAEENLISTVDPIYPAAARASRIQGIVEFTATIGPEGKITDLALVRGNPALVASAKDAVLQWLYHPATQDGQPIAVTTQIFVSFTL